MINKTFKTILLIFLVTVSGKAQSMWDWHITGGSIVDGTGTEIYHADVLIRADTIGFIGEIDADTIKAASTIDASGKIVSPGFIDVHAHGNPLKTPEFRNFLAMGVTTIVLGQDGSSPAGNSLSEWYEKIAVAGLGVNIAALSGHGTIRQRIDTGKIPANDRELRRMEKFLENDLKAGAFGMSTGLEYVPGMYADRDELQRLAETVGKYDAVVMSHMRSEDDSMIEASLDELAAQGKYARVHASHLKVVYGEGAGRAEEILKYIESFRQEGIDFTADVYPYAASFTGIGIVFPDWAKTASEWRQAMQERPEVLRRYLSDKVEQRNGPGAILFGSGKYAGSTLEEASEKEGKSAIDLLLEMGPQAASAAHFVMNEKLQDRIVLGENIMISSDGSPTMRHPRGYGSFPKVIKRYVEEQQSLTIEEAVYKMSGLPAKTLGLEKRGTVKTGNAADLLIFDPEEVRDVATFENPHQLAEGFDWIMVNGKLAREEGNFKEERYGIVLKRNEK